MSSLVYSFSLRVIDLHRGIFAHAYFNWLGLRRTLTNSFKWVFGIYHPLMLPLECLHYFLFTNFTTHLLQHWPIHYVHFLHVFFPNWLTFYSMGNSWSSPCLITYKPKLGIIESQFVASPPWFKPVKTVGPTLVGLNLTLTEIKPTV